MISKVQGNSEASVGTQMRRPMPTNNIQAQFVSQQQGRRYPMPMSPVSSPPSAVMTTMGPTSVPMPPPPISKTGKRQLENLLNQWLSEKNIQLPAKKRCVEQKDEETEEPLSEKDRVWIHSLKSRLFDDLHDVKVIETLCNKALTISGEEMKAEIGGVYLYEDDSTKELLAYCGFPSWEIFSIHFHGYFPAVIQALQQKESFSVTNANSKITFLIAPIIPATHSNQERALGAIVMGFRDNNVEEDSRTVKTALIEVAKLTSTFLSHLHTEHRNHSLWQTLEKLLEENTKLTQPATPPTNQVKSPQMGTRAVALAQMYQQQQQQMQTGSAADMHLIQSYASLGAAAASSFNSPSSMQYVPPSSLFSQQQTPMSISYPTPATSNMQCTYPSHADFQQLNQLDLPFLEESWLADDIVTF